MVEKHTLPPETRIGGVHLGISDLERSLAFYRGLLGFTIMREQAGKAFLAAGENSPVAILLEEIPAAIAKPPRTGGLYHVAIRYPDRAALATALQTLIAHQWPLQGFADHGVSEAIYLPDPDGLGLELYVDRPRESWAWQGNSIAMVTEPLDVRGLLAEAGGPGTSPKLPREADIGHVHLQVGDLAAGRDFYHLSLGFEITQRNYPGALFLAAGGYHHHIGLNTWAGKGAPDPPATAVGLRAFSLVLPSSGARRELAGVLEGQGLALEARPWPGDEAAQAVDDPLGIAVVLEDPATRVETI